VPIAFVRAKAVVARDAEGARNLIGAFVSHELFGILGGGVAAGRVFDARDGDAQVAVLSRRLAHGLYGGVQAAIGAILSTTETTYTVIGVLPDDAGFPNWADVWLPLNALPSDAMTALRQRSLHVDTRVLVRLTAGFPPQRAQAELDAALAALAAQYPEAGAPYDSAFLQPEDRESKGHFRPSATVASGYASGQRCREERRTVRMGRKR